MPRETSSVRLSRLNKLMRALYSKPFISGKELLPSLGYASRRTFERDLSFLREEYGTEIIYDASKQAYTLKGRGSFILNCTLSEQEVLGLVAGLQMAGHFLPHLSREMNSLWGKIKGSLPQNLAECGEELGNNTVLALPVSTMDADIFGRIIDAIRSAHTIRFDYRSPYGSEPGRRRTVSPWGVFFQSHAWYLWGSHDKHEGGATYRISRIKTLEPKLDTPYCPKPADKTLSEYASSGWYAYTGDAQIKVAIKITPPLAEIVPETVWHPTQKTETHADGSITLTAHVADIGAVARWVMASAPYAQALEPQELRDAVEGMAMAVLGGKTR